jgi:hypothetical protein
MIDIMPKKFVADMGERGTSCWPEVRGILEEAKVW